MRLKISPWSGLWAICLAVFLLLAACTVTVPGSKQDPTDKDVSETGSGSLDIEVTDYSWRYLHGGSHISVSGTVVNNSSGPLHGVILACTLHDENGNPIAYGESYVAPTYLKPGGTGTFDFVAMSKRLSGIKATRLIIVARPTGGV